ncbi:transcriptional regulator, TetR family [Collimonas sp. OK607]|uniref:TetR/AcrR family transcriptional regulator n=1 Tax=Collimonas sp. OK607 TaxID=1798194 RepID=UPI0008F231D8|nr:TetR/AcrR family transcriptional regulator [Collimonas sp. OK607]SFA82919.1 transcriptional regulator, TetR family [Collimonas sp. OK607]
MHEDPPVISRRERNKINTTTRLLDAARTLFAEKGVAGTTIEDIAETADVARATFFNYFQNKSAVLQALWADQMARFNLVIDQQLSQDTPTIERLRNIFHAFVLGTIRQPNYLRNVIGELEQDWGTPEISKGRLDALHAALARLIEAGVAQGDVRTDYSSDFLAQMISAAYLSVQRNWRLDLTYDLATSCDEATRFLAAAIAPQKPTRAPAAAKATPASPAKKPVKKQ